MKFKDKLQNYAATKVKDSNSDIIASKSTNSAYFHFNGNVLRISDHLPKNAQPSTATMSIIITPNPDAYVLQKSSTGRLSVVNYKQAKEIVRSFDAISDVFSYPEMPFHLENETVKAILKENGIDNKMVLGLPRDSFTPTQIQQIDKIVTEVKNNRNKLIGTAFRLEAGAEHMKQK